MLNQMPLISKLSKIRWPSWRIASVGWNNGVMKYAPYCSDLRFTTQEATTQTSGAIPLSQSPSQLCMTSRVYIVIELVAMTVMLSTLLATMFCAAEGIVGIQMR